MSWLQSFSDPALAGQLYGGDFPLVDVTIIPDDQIMQHRRVAILGGRLENGKYPTLSLFFKQA